jgi:hypothetical protein
MDEDLDVLLLVVHQLLEPVLDDVFKGAPSGDELERIDFSASDHLNCGAMVVRIPEASQELHLTEHEVIHRHRCLVTPDRDIHAGPADSGRLMAAFRTASTPAHSNETSAPRPS